MGRVGKKEGRKGCAGRTSHVRPCNVPAALRFTACLYLATATSSCDIIGSRHFTGYTSFALTTSRLVAYLSPPHLSPKEKFPNFPERSCTCAKLLAIEYDVNTGEKHASFSRSRWVRVNICQHCVYGESINICAIYPVIVEGGRERERRGWTSRRVP